MATTTCSPLRRVSAKLNTIERRTALGNNNVICQSFRRPLGESSSNSAGTNAAAYCPKTAVAGVPIKLVEGISSNSLA